MVALTALWLPILLSAVFVFVASSIIHMFLPYHRSDMKKLPDEDGVMDALRGFDIPAGDYVIPYAGSPEVMKSEEFREKAKQGPMAFMTVLPSGDPFAMGSQLAQWFIYCVVVSVFAAYLTGRTASPDWEYLMVFRVTGTVAFAGYALALWQRSIWYKQALSTTVKATFDALIYALLTAGVFGWLWP